MTDNLKDIIEAYREIYQGKVRDFNILSTIHLSENDHTNILCEILNMQINGECPFMASFVKEVLCLDVNTKDLIAKTQVRAIGPQKTGYIDMLIEEKSSQNVRIIVENKVCGAGDRAHQLAEYYYSFVHDNTEAYKELDKRGEDFRRKYQVQESLAQNTYLAYLTDSAEREYPSEIKREWLNSIKFKHISYEDDVYDWLKYKVLPIVPYGKSGDAHNSIILYLRELENLLGTNGIQNKWYLENDKIKRFIETHVITQSADNVEKYNKLNAIYNALRNEAKKANQNDNLILFDLINCILCYRDNVFGQFAPQGWKIHCAANYITFYPTYWLGKFGGTKSSCIHFVISQWTKGKIRSINLNIHNNACKRNITLTPQIYDKARTNIDNIVYDILNTKDKLYKTNYDDILSLFEQNGHFYWHVALDAKKLGVSWKPNAKDNQIKEFFEKITNHETIRELIQYIDENFK